VVSQLVTAAVLVALAATLHASGARDLGTVGQISRALTPFLGGLTGRLVFGMGVVGASMVAAIVCSLAFLWGIAEVAGAPAARARLRAGYVAGVVTAALVVQEVPDLVTLSVAAQALNAVLMPVLVTLLIALAATVLPAPVRLRGAALWRAGGLCAVVAGAGVAGALAGLF
jgi:Mn2+/Fe2+ NRAMP family transporter